MLFFINIEEPFFFLMIMSTREFYIRLMKPSSSSVVIEKECQVLRLENESGHHAKETPLYLETVENHRNRAPSGVYWGLTICKILLEGGLFTKFCEMA